MIGVQVKIDHLNIIKFGQFDYNVFYKDVLLRANNLKNEDWVEPRQYDSVESIVTSIDTHKNSLRCFSRLNLCLGSDVSMKVSLYNITKGKYSLLPASSLVTRNDNSKVTTSTVLELNSGELVLPNEISYYTKVQGEIVNFSKEERAFIQGFESQNIKVLGFLNLSLIKPNYTFGHSSFVIPTETSGYKLFTLLLKKCAELNQAIMCSVVFRRKGKPRLCSMIPHLEDEKFPNGFFLKPLPYADDIRSNVVASLKAFDKREAHTKTRTAIDLIKSYSNPNFEVGSIRDPRIDMKWAAVEALALQRSEMEKIVDETLPLIHGVKRSFSDD